MMMDDDDSGGGGDDKCQYTLLKITKIIVMDHSSGLLQADAADFVIWGKP